LAAVFGALAYFIWSYTGQKPADRVAGYGGRGRGFWRDDGSPVVVAVESAKLGDIPVYLRALGTVTALKTVTVHSRVDGELVRVNFTEGQLLKAGDLLAEIDPRPFQAQLQQAQGQLRHDEALLNNAVLDLSRYRTLQAQDSIPAQQAITQAALVEQYQGTVEMDNGLVNTAKLQLNYARLIAPISGRAGLRLIDQGNIIHAGDASGLVVITQLEPISVVFNLAEDKVPMLNRRWRNEKPIRVEAYDRAGKIKLAEGVLTAIDNQIDPATGTLKLKAQFDNHEQTLFANQFVNIKMHVQTLAGRVLIPAAAVQHDSSGPYVYAVTAEKTAELRHIALEPGGGEDDKAVVAGELGVDELVVVEGADRLKSGSRLDIARQDGQEVAASPENKDKSEDKRHKRQRRSKANDGG
jgi:multidrug efflux system membrane fusion protein